MIFRLLAALASTIAFTAGTASADPGDDVTSLPDGPAKCGIIEAATLETDATAIAQFIASAKGEWISTSPDYGTGLLDGIEYYTKPGFEVNDERFGKVEYSFHEKAPVPTRDFFNKGNPAAKLQDIYVSRPIEAGPFAGFRIVQSHSPFGGSCSVSTMKVDGDQMEISSEIGMFERSGLSRYESWFGNQPKISLRRW